MPLIEKPFQGIVLDILAGALQVFVIPNDVIVIAALPNMFRKTWQLSCLDRADHGVGGLDFVPFYHLRQGRTCVSARDDQDHMNMVRKNRIGINSDCVFLFQFL